MNTVIIVILQTREMRNREIKQLAQGHTSADPGFSPKQSTSRVHIRHRYMEGQGVLAFLQTAV